jgi:SAM-dependent methyltransferase
MRTPGMTDLETTNCPLCGAGGGVPVYGGAGFAPYGVVGCPGCGLQYLSPRLTEPAMAAHYASDHYFQGGAQGYDDYAEQEPALRATFRRFLQALARRGRTGGALLEIGCGYGYLLDEARPHFTRRVGTDFSPAAAQAAARRADAVHAGGADAVPAGERFDCIVATHVIEHVYRPHQFVRTLLQHLKPGGSLVLAAPDAGSFWRRGMGRRWPSFKLPEHVLYFDRRTLGRLMAECGLVELAPVPFPHAFPLPLVASKLGLRLPRTLQGINLWLPATTVAMIGVKPHD